MVYKSDDPTSERKETNMANARAGSPGPIQRRDRMADVKLSCLVCGNMFKAAEWNDLYCSSCQGSEAARQKRQELKAFAQARQASIRLVQNGYPAWTR